MDDETIGIEEEFRKSWDWIESFFLRHYEEFEWTQLLPMVHFIRELKALGYDEWFRAGQSLATFIISRSKKHGLEANQSCIYFDLGSGGEIEVHAYIAGQSYSLKLNEAKLNTELKILLELLMAQPID